MVTTAPGGEMLEIKRRCWIGRGGVTPPSTIRVTSAELGYSGDLDFVLPTGLSLLPAHDGLRYHHGGSSLQELVIPVVTFRIEATVASKGKSRVALSGLPAAITNRMFSVTIETQADLLAEPQNVRVLLFSGADQAGQTGMVLNADWDRETGNVTILPGKPASIGLMLTKENYTPEQRILVRATSNSAFPRIDRNVTPTHFCDVVETQDVRLAECFVLEAFERSSYEDSSRIAFGS
jgi:hypothetical protein